MQHPKDYQEEPGAALTHFISFRGNAGNRLQKGGLPSLMLFS